MYEVLVVDDEPSVRDVLREALVRTEEYNVQEAADGVEALEKMRAADSRFDAVLIDLAMPRMNGTELLEKVTGEYENVVCIIITALHTESSVLRCLQLGALDYIVKPFHIKSVLAAISRAIKLGQAGFDSSRISIGVGGHGSWVELSGPSDIEYVLRFRKFTEALLSSRLALQDREDIRLAVDEIGRNAIEWGNEFDPAKKVHLAFRILPEKVEIRVSDEGAGFLPSDVDDPTADPLGHLKRRLKSGKRMGGYGILLAKNAMDELVFEEDGRSVLMTKRIS